MSSWPLAQLGEVVCRPNTWNPATSIPNDSFVYVDLSAVDQQTKQIVGARLMTGQTAPSRARQLVAAGDVLVSTVRPNLNSVARVQPELDGATASTGFCVLRPRDGSLDGNYLFHWVRTNQFVASMTERATGASYPAVSDKIVLDSTIPLPPLDEQRQIAQVLDRAEALLAKRRAAMALLDTLTQSVFLDMFGDPKSNDRQWSTTSINSIATDLRGGANLAPEDFVDSGYPVLHKGALKPNGDIMLDGRKKTFARAHFVQANPRSQVDRSYLAVTLRDLIPSGPSIGHTVQLRYGPYDNYLLAQGVLGFRLVPNTVLGEYLVYLSNMPTFRDVLRQSAVGSTQIHIRNPIYLNIEIPVPPLPLQRAFASYVTGLHVVRSLQMTSLGRLNALLASLQHRAFRGEL